MSHESLGCLKKITLMSELLRDNDWPFEDSYFAPCKWGMWHSRSWLEKL